MADFTYVAARYYLAAIVDGEGCIVMGKTPRISISNTEPSIILACVDALDTLDIAHSVVTHNKQQDTWKACLEVKIGRKDAMEKFRELVPLQSAAKTARLQRLDLSYKRKLKSRRPNGLTRSEVESLMAKVGM